MWLMGGLLGVFDGGPGGVLVAVGCSIEVAGLGEMEGRLLMEEGCMPCKWIC